MNLSCLPVAALCLLTLVLAGATSAHADEPVFGPVRQPLLGFVVERRAASDAHRLVALEPTRRVITTGTRAACEARLLAEITARHGTGKLNVELKTLGGKQVWADRVLLAGWRIQENALTGLCRLLDPDDVRHAWGSFEACRVVLEGHRQRLALAWPSSHLVLLLHGMGRSKASLATLTRTISAAGFAVADVSYPSTRKTIREHSRQLEALLSSCEGIRELSIVTHSLGGIVARDLLGLAGPWTRRIQVRRLVMLAPPSRGSIAAEQLKGWFAYKLLMGVVGQQLTPAALAKLPAPTCPFGIIAGGNGGEGYNPLLPGDDDGVVTVANTRLAGAADFLLVPSLHTTLMDHPSTLQAVVRFLRTGRFGPRPADE